MKIPAEFQPWPGHVGNWGRWPNDRGALNLITPEVTLRGVGSVRTGQVVSCARTIKLKDPNNDTVKPAAHEMIYVKSGSGPHGDASGDQMSFRMHGMINTHIDAFSHVGFRDYCFNGRSFHDTVDMEHGAHHCDITDMLGIVTRGVFIDVARRRGVTGLKPGDCVLPEDIQPLLDRLEPGDAAIVRTGVTLTGGAIGTPGPDGKPDIHYPIAGFHPDCIELLGQKGASLVASDSPSDAYPSPLREVCDSPVHRLCLVIYGMPLVHNMDLEELGDARAGQETSTCLFMVSPLKLAHATGSPCTPVCVL